MLALIVDNDELELKLLASHIKDIHPECTLQSFQDPLLALKYGVANEVVALYARADMRRMSGLELGRLLKSHHPGMSLTLVGDETEAKGALRSGAQGFVPRPITREGVRQAEAGQVAKRR